jgi:hypothetical protein
MGIPYTVQAEEPMIPIWAKDRSGKWQVFPRHLLKTFEDGVQGTDGYYLFGSSADFFLKDWFHLFTYDTANCRYILKKQL